MGELCTECEEGKYTSEEGAPECTDCYKPVCAKSVNTCHPISGLEQTFTYYDIFEAPNVICGEVEKNSSDTCAAPSTCVPNAAQCSAEPSRWALRSSAITAPDVSTLWAPGTLYDWGVLDACPDLHRPPSRLATPACWDQMYHETSTLHYSSDARNHTAILPAFKTTCGGELVEARYEFIFIACSVGSAECSDELIDCPSSADLSRRWWEGFADTLAISNVSTVRSFTASLNASLMRQ